MTTIPVDDRTISKVALAGLSDEDRAGDAYDDMKAEYDYHSSGYPVEAFAALVALLADEWSRRGGEVEDLTDYIKSIWIEANGDSKNKRRAI